MSGASLKPAWVFATASAAATRSQVARERTPFQTLLQAYMPAPEHAASIVRADAQRIQDMVDFWPRVRTMSGPDDAVASIAATVADHAGHADASERVRAGAELMSMYVHSFWFRDWMLASQPLPQAAAMWDASPTPRREAPPTPAEQQTLLMLCMLSRPDLEGDELMRAALEASRRPRDVQDAIFRVHMRKVACCVHYCISARGDIEDTLDQVLQHVGTAPRVLEHHAHARAVLHKHRPLLRANDAAVRDTEIVAFLGIFTFPHIHRAAPRMSLRPPTARDAQVDAARPNSTHAVRLARRIMRRVLEIVLYLVGFQESHGVAELERAVDSEMHFSECERLLSHLRVRCSIMRRAARPVAMIETD